MKIIISPAKKMNIDTDTLPVRNLPWFLEDAKVLCSEIFGGEPDREGRRAERISRFGSGL